MDRVYIMESGKITKDYPDLFWERTQMIRNAEHIAASLKHTKKLQGNDFYQAYLNDPQVKEYRELMRRIWNFKVSDSILDVRQCCDSDNCMNHDVLYDVDWILSDGYHFKHVKCAECAEAYKKDIESFGDKVEIIGVHQDGAL